LKITGSRGTVLLIPFAFIRYKEARARFLCYSYCPKGYLPVEKIPVHPVIFERN